MSKRKVTICGIAIAAILLLCFCTVKKVTDNKEAKDYNDHVEITQDKDGMAVITGQNKSGSDFQINLNYMKTDVILNNAYLMDVTNDNKQELCLELNIFNSVSPDFNTILIYDMKNERILFPTPDKAMIYDSYIDQVKMDRRTKKTIRYSSYTKINGNAMEDENSVIQWNGSSFDTLEYQNKLLVETDEYLACYYKSSSDEVTSNKLIILDPYTLQATQEIELRADEAEITRNIKNHEFIRQADNGSYDLYVEGYGNLYWDRTLKKFNKTES